MKYATPPQVLSPTTAADRLGVSPQYVRMLCREHGIGTKLDDRGSMWVIYPDHLKRLKSILDSLPPRRPRISKVAQ
jgi:hypothetical protein